MSKGKKPDIWFKLYAEKFLWGTIKGELKVDERAVWIDFLCLAATFEGIVDITYPAKLASMLIIPLELLERSIKVFTKTKRIKIQHDKEEIKIYAKILKWGKYQSERLGGDQELKGKSATLNGPREAQRKTDPEKKRLEKIRLEERGEEDRKGEESLREEENLNDLPPLPKNLPFPIQDKLKELRAYVRVLKKRYANKDYLEKKGITEGEALEEIRDAEKEYCDLVDSYKD